MKKLSVNQNDREKFIKDLREYHYYEASKTVCSRLSKKFSKDFHDRIKNSIPSKTAENIIIRKDSHIILISDTLKFLHNVMREAITLSTMHYNTN